MRHSTLLLLPPADRTLLRIAGRIVPAADRPDWDRAWQAELWHKRNQALRKRHIPCNRGPWPTASLAAGLIGDALWLRAHRARQLLRGTALLCLGTLSSLCLLSAVLAVALHSSLHTLALRLAGLLPRVTLAAVLVIFVTFSVAHRRPTEPASSVVPALWLRRQGFFAAKLALLLLLAFLLSTAVAEPIAAPHPLTADFLQILSFVLLALLALRWALADQQQRCKHCLRSLAAPARVGRPSRNLLEWNGTELSCKRGHGRLTIPELETSWCRSSQWITRPLQRETLTT